MISQEEIKETIKKARNNNYCISEFLARMIIVFLKRNPEAKFEYVLHKILDDVSQGSLNDKK